MKEEMICCSSPAKKRICGIRIPVVEQKCDVYGRKYIEYVIQVKSNGRTYHVYRRYSEFFFLNEQLKTKYGMNSTDFPQKRYWGNLDAVFLEKRRSALEEYLRNLLETCLNNSDEWKQFLDPNIEKYTDPNNQSCKGLSISRDVKSGVMEVKILEGRNFCLPNLPESELEFFSYFTLGEADPSLSSCLAHQTKSVRGCVKPQWDFSKNISLENLDSECITFYVKMIGGEFLSYCTSNLSDLEIEETPKDFWLTLSNQLGDSFSCEIHVALSFTQCC